VWRFFNPGGLDRHRVRHALSVTVLYVFMPALAFGLLASARVDRSFIIVPLTGIAAVMLCTAAGFAVYSLVPRLRKIPRPAFGVVVLAATYGNVTYLGLPVITEMLGQDKGYVAILYDLLAHTPLVLTIGAFIAARYGSGDKMSVAGSLKRVITLPPLWGVAAGIAVHFGEVTVPQPLLEAAALMGKAVIPIMTFTVGLALDFGDLKRLPLAAPALAIKLILAPVIAWWVGSRLGLTGDLLRAVTLEGAMPVMVFLLVIADEFDLDVPLAANSIAVSTVLLFFTMPLMLKVLL
jgi:predicted permease